MREMEELEYVGFWLRFWASVIDSVLMMVVLAPLAWLLFGPSGWDNMVSVNVEGGRAFVLNYLVPALLVLAFWSRKHATPGKMVFGARIVDARTGADPTLKQHVIRYLGYFLSFFFFFLGFIWVAFDPRKQGWHDKLAQTVVVRKRRGRTEPVRFA